MMERCTLPSSKDFPYYGGRGISVCFAWHDVGRFIADMGARPAGTSIDRIDPDGNYEPANCRWATPIQQGKNKRNHTYVRLNGVVGYVAEVSRMTGIPETTVRRNAEVIR
jgi:hypothetical protein